MADFYCYLKLNSYLRDWFVHKQGGEIPVKLTKGSAEWDLIDHLRDVPPINNTKWDIEGCTQIIMPTSRDKDIRVYNYLSPNAKRAIENTIYNEFRINVWAELHKIDNLGANIGDLIYAYMDRHGIADDGKNWETIRQMYYRKRDKTLKIRKRKL